MYVSTMDQMRAYYAGEEKKYIRKNAERVGIVLLLAVGMQFVAVLADMVLGLLVTDFQEVSISLLLQKQSMADYMLFTLAEYVVYMGVPVFAGWLLFRKRDVTIVPLQKTDGSFGVGLLLLGLGMMVIANIIGSYLLSLFETVGVTPVDVPDMQDGTMTVLLLNILTVGIMPGVFEELLFRGVVLQGLRPAGDGAALVFSSLMFGLMHGTLYQIPFAFILGLVFGYIVLKTGNILWTMGLHAVNNTLAVLMEYWLWNVPDEETSKWYLLFFAIETLLGIVGAAVLMMRSHPRVSPVGDRVSSWLTLKQRRRALYSSATVIAFIVLMALITLGSTRFEGLPGFEAAETNAPPAIGTGGEQQSAAVFAEVFR